MVYVQIVGVMINSGDRKVVRDGTAAESATERSSAIPLEVLRDSWDAKAFMTTLLYPKITTAKLHRGIWSDISD